VPPTSAMTQGQEAYRHDLDFQVLRAISLKTCNGGSKELA